MPQRAYVFINLNHEWIPCGLLEYQEDGNRSSAIFRYGKRYLERKNAISIDPVQLPLEDRSFETPEGFALFNGIRDAGPDKWGRYLLDKKFSRTLSELDYILQSSEDRVGALSFSSSLDFIPSPLPQRLILAECSEAIEDAIHAQETEKLKLYLSYGPSLGGARPKATVLWKKALYLAKFSLSLDSKDEPLIEYATMSLAKKCGLNVPEIHLEKIQGRSIFLIKRFDRTLESRIPFISGLTITGAHESDYSSWSYLSLADAIVRFSENPDRDLRELFNRLIFNIGVYNNDDHLRNFGFLASGKYWNLSPVYDVSPSVIHTSTYNLAMTLGLEGRKASFENALSLRERFRLDARQAKHIIQNIQEHIHSWEKHFNNLGVSQKERIMLKPSFQKKV